MRFGAMTCVCHLNRPVLRHKKICGFSLFTRLWLHHPFLSLTNTTCRINFCWLLGLKELLIQETELSAALNKAKSATGSTELLLKSYSTSYSYVNQDFYPLIFLLDQSLNTSMILNRAMTYQSSHSYCYNTVILICAVFLVFFLNISTGWSNEQSSCKE